MVKTNTVKIVDTLLELYPNYYLVNHLFMSIGDVLDRSPILKTDNDLIIYSFKETEKSISYDLNRIKKAEISGDYKVVLLDILAVLI